MEKNESGYPRAATLSEGTQSGETVERGRRSCTGELRSENGSVSSNSRAMQNGTSGGMNGAGSRTGMNGNTATEGAVGTCGGGGVLDGASLAYVYAPSQRFCMLYSSADALKHGTLFEELYKPREVYGYE